MHRTFIILILLVLMPSSAVYGADTKQERNFIVEGNNLYKQKRFAEAETMYKKALTVSPTSEVARFNLASALIRQSGSADPNSGNTPLSDAIALLSDLEKTAQTAAIVEKAAYDLGNISFNAQQYQQAVEHYKNALRKNPDNDKARENLRLAQKKLEEQQQNQNNNQDQKDKQDKQDQKEQNQQQQQNQNQQQNQDKKDDQKPQDQPQQQDKKENGQQPPRQQSGGISDDNAEKILKAMENEEAATRKKVEARKQKANNARRRQVTRPW
ncbi:MAG: tetratricopeptide repeat protein [Paramuribaculum sp.]|nr:tetratricopeptide repeat protein [Paramuribaculum sp.]